MNKPADWAVAACTDHEQVKRRAVERKLLSRISIRRVRLDALQPRDSLARGFDQLLDVVLVGKRRCGVRTSGEEHGLERRELGTVLGGEPSRHTERVLAFGRAVVAHPEL